MVKSTPEIITSLMDFIGSNFCSDMSLMVYVVDAVFEVNIQTKGFSELYRLLFSKLK